ncbi:MAG: replisome organizer [Ruminococcus flavefaciens]|nr:replisome organizer [Ruminococcus flavefaciens]MCM1060589.1 replisome organizer [Eubacterium sp.]
MAERRMFAKTIIDSDAFLDMPVTSRLLYYDLAMRADDDGFVNAPKKIMRMIGASQDDLSILVLRKFIIPFDNGIVVIKHWRIHNYIRKDRYNETAYTDQKALLFLDENNAYQLEEDSRSTTVESGGQPLVDQRLPQVRLGKVSIGKDNKEREQTAKRFTPPTVEEVQAYCQERGNNIDPEHFVDFYASKGWKVGSNPMKDWKACVRTWEKRNGSNSKSGANGAKLADSSGNDFFPFISTSND